MSKYTAEQVQKIRAAHYEYMREYTAKPDAAILSVLDDYAAILRERESAKAEVTELCTRNPAPHAAQAPDPTSPTIVVASMLASARVPDALSAEDVVEKYPNYWQWETNRLSTFARGWNACRKVMLAAPKPDKE